MNQRFLHPQLWVYVCKCALKINKKPIYTWKGYRKPVHLILKLSSALHMFIINISYILYSDWIYKKKTDNDIYNSVSFHSIKI